MKELTIEEKAKRYDELIVTAQELEHDGCFDKITLFDLFPELEESEDERIKKAIKYGLDYVFTNNTTVYETTKEQCLAWLEKQGEKGTNGNEREIPNSTWSDEDERRINHIIAFMSDKERIKDTETMFPIEEDIRWLKFLRPQRQWKPSDEQMDALRYVTNFDYGGHKATLVSLYEQLKKL